MVSKYFINVKPEEIVANLKQLRVDMLEYERLSIKPHPSVIHMKLTRILEKMNVGVDDNEH